jgi:penicillin-binding protein 2
MTSASFMPEYKRQWVADLKRKGLYKDPKVDSVKLKRQQDSLNFIKEQKAKLKKKIEEETKNNTKNVKR